MLKSSHILPVVLLLVLGHAEGQNYAGPTSLGPFRIDKDVAMKALFVRLGQPSSNTTDVSCYRSGDGKTFLALTRMVAAYDSTIAGLATLSSFPNCINQTVKGTPDNLAAWKTEKGIGLSSTADDVRKAYGKPSSEDRIEGAKYRWVINGSSTDERHTTKTIPELGNTVLVYEGPSDDLRTAEFGIREGKVVWISLSKNE